MEKDGYGVCCMILVELWECMVKCKKFKPFHIKPIKILVTQ